MIRTLTLITIFLLGMIATQAATLTVTTTADAGAGSLRQAMTDAITNAEANDIRFAIPTSDPGYDLPTGRFTILLASTLPAIPVPVTTIVNNQTQALTIRGNNTFPIFALVNSAVVTMTNITISHGSTSGDGGGIQMGNSATLTLNFCNVSNNTAGSRGGAIFMSDSGTLHVHQSTFTSNSAQYGGAIFPFLSATVNMDQTTLNGNSAIDSGGGIYVESAATLNATNNTFSGNTAGNYGGAIVNQATITLTSNTIAGNSASGGGGIANFGAAATLNNNIVALNTASFGPDLLGDGFIGNMYTGTFNLIGNSDGSLGLNTTTNMWGTTETALDLKLGPLQNNGGPSHTHALLFDSPVLDQGNAPGLTTDQRGFLRPIDDVLVTNAGDGSDIGAFEFAFSPTAASVSISGRVIIAQGKEATGINNATILVSSADGTSWIARSNAFGYFELTGIPAGDTYLITVTHKRYTFDTRTLNLQDDVKELTFASN